MSTEKVGTHDIPGTQRMTAHIPSVAAATATIVYPIFSAPFKCTVTKVICVAQDNVAGDDTDRKNLNVLDTGAAGAGTTEIGNKDLITGVNMADMDETEIDVTDTELSDGDVLALQIEKAGNGVLLPAMLVIVEYEGT